MRIFGRVINGQYHEADMTEWTEVVKPAHDPRYQRLTGPVLSSDGTQYVYSVEDITIAELAPSITAQIVGVRQRNLDTIAKSAGVSAAYDTNIAAANAIVAGSGDATEMWEGMTATQYATGMGAKMGMTAVEWASWVRAENQRERLRGTLIEQQYIEFKVAISVCTDVALMAQYPEMYRLRAESIMEADDPASVVLDPVPTA